MCRFAAKLCKTLPSMFLHRGRKKWICKSLLNDFLHLQMEQSTIYCIPGIRNLTNLCLKLHICYIWFPVEKYFWLPSISPRLRLKCLVLSHWDSVSKSPYVCFIFSNSNIIWNGRANVHQVFTICIVCLHRFALFGIIFFTADITPSSTRDLLDLQGPGIGKVNGVSVVFDTSCGICPFGSDPVLVPRMFPSEARENNVECNLTFPEQHASLWAIKHVIFKIKSIAWVEPTL